MSYIDTPQELFDRILSIYPQFVDEFDNDEKIETYHQIIMDLTPVITGYLEGGSKRSTNLFCNLVNEMMEAGGDLENAISTCLLEHASQVRCHKILLPLLGERAKLELG